MAYLVIRPQSYSGGGGYRVVEVVGRDADGNGLTIEWHELFEHRTTAKKYIEKKFKVSLTEEQWKNLDYWGATVEDKS